MGKFDRTKRHIETEVLQQRVQVQRLKGLLQTLIKILVRLEDEVENLPTCRNTVCDGDGSLPECPLLEIKHELDILAEKTYSILRESNILGFRIDGPIGCCRIPPKPKMKPPPPTTIHHPSVMRSSQITVVDPKSPKDKHMMKPGPKLKLLPNPPGAPPKPKAPRRPKLPPKTKALPKIKVLSKPKVVAKPHGVRVKPVGHRSKAVPPAKQRTKEA